MALLPFLCSTVLFHDFIFMLILALFLRYSCFSFLAADQVLIFFAYIVYIYKLYINTYIYYLILSLLQICMFPGFVFCTSYARAHVYRSWFAISALEARTHFCVFNSVVFSVDGVSSYSSDFALFGAFLLATCCLFPQGLPRCFLSCAFLRF